MNILKALEGLSAKQDGNNEMPAETPAAKPQASYENEISSRPNPMASIIERHERISNRVRTNAKK